MMAMLKLWRSERLKELGWKLLLQIHDEVILEGPKETRDEVCGLHLCRLWDHSCSDDAAKGWLQVPVFVLQEDCLNLSHLMDDTLIAAVD